MLRYASRRLGGLGGYPMLVARSEFGLFTVVIPDGTFSDTHDVVSEDLAATN